MSWEEGGGGLNDFINHLTNVEEVKHEKGEKGAEEAIMELKSLIRNPRVNRNPINETGTAGPLTDIIKTFDIWKRKRNRKRTCG